MVANPVSMQTGSACLGAKGRTMDDHTESKTTQASDQAPGQVPSGQDALSRRRKFLKLSGAVGAPALLALHSSPVVACTCKLPSGFSVSGNLSQTGSLVCSKPAPQPSSWRSSCSGSPLKYTGTTIKTTDKLLGKGFATCTKYNTDITFDAALNLGTSDPRALLAALFLEASAGGFKNTNGTPLTAQIVKDMWNDGIANVATTTGYKPVSTMPSLIWKEANIIAYARYSMGLS